MLLLTVNMFKATVFGRVACCSYMCIEGRKFWFRKMRHRSRPLLGVWGLGVEGDSVLDSFAIMRGQHTLSEVHSTLLASNLGAAITTLILTDLLLSQTTRSNAHNKIQLHSPPQHFASRYVYTILRAGRIQTKRNERPNTKQPRHDMSTSCNSIPAARRRPTLGIRSSNRALSQQTRELR